MSFAQKNRLRFSLFYRDGYDRHLFIPHPQTNSRLIPARSHFPQYVIAAVNK